MIKAKRRLTVRMILLDYNSSEVAFTPIDNYNVKNVAF